MRLLPGEPKNFDKGDNQGNYEGCRNYGVYLPFAFDLPCGEP